jgi:two-component system NtrC family sensor kinase
VDLVRDMVRKLDSGAEAVRDKAREQLGRLLDRCKEAALRTKTIVQDLRTFSRLHRAEVQAVDLHEGLESTLNLLTSRQGEGIRFRREYGPLPSLECHAGQLHQVFMNLLQNACDAVAERGGGTVTVRTALRRAAELPDFEEALEPDQAVVVVQVEDDGVGIPADLLPRIFDPFFTTKPVGSGTGLGLSISWQIVRRHGGRIRVDSEPGKGSTFHVEIPRRPLPAEGG